MAVCLVMCAAAQSDTHQPVLGEQDPTNAEFGLLTIQRGFGALRRALTVKYSSFEQRRDISAGVFHLQLQG